MFIDEDYVEGGPPCTKVLVLMLGAKTHVLPPEDGPCEIDVITWIDVEDGVPNQGVGANGDGDDETHLARFWGNWGQVHVIHGPGGNSNRYPHHHIDNYVNPPFDLYADSEGDRADDGTIIVRTYDPRGSGTLDFGPLQAVEQHKDDYDYIFIAHSQGTNIAMHSLHKLCGGMRQHQLVNLSGDLESDFVVD